MNFVSRILTRLTVPCVLLVAAGLPSRVNAEEYIKSYPVNGRADVRVRADDSSVRVITSDSAQVEFRVKYAGFAAVEFGGKLHVDSHQNGGQVELTVHLSPGIVLGVSNRQVSTEVHMPRNADLRLETRDGHVEVASLSGNITVRTTDGGIKASQLSGTIDLQTSDGGMSVDALKGDFKLRTGDGTIGATNLDGKCEASSSDGSIHLAGRFDSLDIKSGDGGVVARIAPGSRMSSAWSIRSGDGGVDLALPTDFRANLDVSTKDGHITLGLPVTVQGDLGTSLVRGTMNGGGPSLVIRTGDGSIHLKGV